MAYVSTMEAMGDFVDVAIFIVMILIVWYIVKLFWVGNKKNEGGGDLGQFISEKIAASKKKKEVAAEEAEAKAVRKGKEEKVSPIKENLHNTLTALDNIFTHLTHKEKALAKKQFAEVKKELRNAVGNTCLLATKFQGAEREQIEKVITFLQSAEKEYVEDIKDKIPKKVTNPNWKDIIHGTASVPGVLSHIEKLKGSIGNAWKHLEQFCG